MCTAAPLFIILETESCPFFWFLALQPRVYCPSAILYMHRCDDLESLQEGALCNFAILEAGELCTGSSTGGGLRNTIRILGKTGTGVTTDNLGW
jgi:hypothetical protein